MQVLLECCYIWKVHNGKIGIISFLDLIRLKLTTVEISLYLYSQRLLDISFLSVPDNGYFRGELCALNYIYLSYY